MKMLSLFLMGISLFISCQAQLPSNTQNLSAKHQILFLDSTNAAKAITQDKKEGFFEKIEQLDMEIQMSQSSKVSKAKLVTQYKEYLAKDVQSFTAEEQQFLQGIMDKAYKICQNLSNTIFPAEIKLIKTSMNHYGPSVYYTRENCIIIPQNVLMTRRADKVLQTMLHEIFHVYSRYNVEKKNALYERIGYTKIDKVEIPKSLKKRILLNPDGVDYLYTIKNLSTEGNTSFDGIPLLYSRVGTFNDDNALFFTYLKFSLFEVKNGKVIAKEDGSPTVEMGEIQNFFKQIGKNTNYIIHPDEVLADNFIFLSMWRAGEKSLADFEIKTEYGKQLLLDMEKIIKQ